jgi:hypothetical protein
VFLAAVPAPAQPATEVSSLFDAAQPLSFALEAPLRALRRDSRTRPERAGSVKYFDAAGEAIVLDVEVRIRGNSRLINCDFPPLRLDFRRGQLDGTVFAGQNRLKLVTLCKSRDNYRDYLHLEHDIYKLFNALTAYSFRVRRANVEYRSTDSRREEVFAEPAFLIEEEWEVAARHGLNVIEQQAIEFSSLDPQHAALLSVFQFMIGNTDWSALRGPGEENCCHNGKVIGTGGSGYIVLPYDFDQAGLISTEYSQPSESLPIRTVRQRLYRGFCVNNSAVDSAAEHVLARRTELEDVLQSSNASADARSQALEYLRESLDLLADPRSRTSEVIESCRP